MRIGIDASNIRGGGGLTHLSEMLKHALPHAFGIQHVIVWGGGNTLSQLSDQPWLKKVHLPALDGLLPQRVWWQQFVLPKLLEQNECDLLFSPGGILPRHTSVPTVTMSRNLLPFDDVAISTYPKMHLHKKFAVMVVRILQRRSFIRATGLIFLTRFAQKTVLSKIGNIQGKMTIIPHGLSKAFFCEPRLSLSLESYSLQNPFKLLYVSTIHVYKYQWAVAEAVGNLREQNFPVAIDFVGGAYLDTKRFNKTIKQSDPQSEFIKYLGRIPYSQLPMIYRQADGFVFASICENMPNILLEAMASGLAIASSKRGPMPEILGDAGVYFDSENTESIVEAIHRLMVDRDKREEYAWAAYRQAQQFTWERCAKETFCFLSEIAKNKCI
jgi:glycosyltransferase involved in cell wall biosynthesis